MSKHPRKRKAVKTVALDVLPARAVSYETAFRKVVAMIEAARARAFQAVNTGLIDLYWRVGEFISRRIAADGWGKNTVSDLAEFIHTRRPGISGFSASNLWRMRQFYETYASQVKLAALLRELNWTQNLLIMARAKRPEEREFYLRLCVSASTSCLWRSAAFTPLQHTKIGTRPANSAVPDGRTLKRAEARAPHATDNLWMRRLCVREKWASRELERQLRGALFERTVLAPPKVSPLVTQLHPAAESIFKDTYLLDFLDLPAVHAEADLQRSLVTNLKRKLHEFYQLAAASAAEPPPASSPSPPSSALRKRKSR